MKYKVVKPVRRAAASHPPRGAWVEIRASFIRRVANGCRTPRGVRGLKSGSTMPCTLYPGRTPRGVRGLKSSMSFKASDSCGRTPRGVRGLKSTIAGASVGLRLVAPPAGCVG